MSGLRDLQDQFQQAILAGTPGFRRQIEATERVGVDKRIEIYSDAYRARLVEALTDDYDALHKVLGDETFQSLCLAFIEAQPSHHYSIRWYGAELSQFIRQQPPFDAHPYLAELAAFQWALMNAFDAANATPIEMQDVAQVPPEHWPQMRLAPHPSLNLLALEWRVPQLWQELQDGDDNPAPPQRSDTTIDWVIWRRDLQSYFRSTTPAEAAALRALLDGASFGELCEQLCQFEDDEAVALFAAGLLKRWITDEMIVSLSV